MRYKAILLDADDTIFDFPVSERAAITALLAMAGIDAPDAPDAYHEINDACWKDLEKGLITRDELKQRRFIELGARYHHPMDTKWAAETYESLLSEQVVPLPGALEAVQQIAEHLPIAIVTNGIARVQRRRFALSPFAPLIRALIISEEVGAAKPDPKMIHVALDALGGVRAQDALLIGDSLTSDMLAGVRAGVDRCWYNPQRTARPEDLVIQYEIDDIRKIAEIALI